MCDELADEPVPSETDGIKFSTYKELDEPQMKHIIDILTNFDTKFGLFDLEFNKLEDEFLTNLSSTRIDKNYKHLRQISSIISHVEVLLEKNDCQKGSTCLIELGAGRGKLSYWYEQSRCDTAARDPTYLKRNVNIVLIERGSQRFKFDSMLKKDIEESNSKFERIRIDLKDFYINKVGLVESSDRYLMYGKHLCGVATDFALRSMKISLEAMKTNEIKFCGLVLAVCCHHQCTWESFVGKKFLQSLSIDSNMFYILRSITSWYVTASESNSTPAQGIDLFNLNLFRI